MGVFDSLFSNNDNSKSELPKLNWNYLEEINLDTVDQISNEKPVVLFKHSTRCIISRTVLKNFENSYNISKDKMELYFLDLLKYRSISNEIAERYQVTHQSPQIIVIKNGKAVFNESHDGILVEDLKQFL